MPSAERASGWTVRTRGGGSESPWPCGAASTARPQAPYFDDGQTSGSLIGTPFVGAVPLLLATGPDSST